MTLFSSHGPDFYSDNRVTDARIIGVDGNGEWTFTERVGPTPKRVQVDKTTHRIRFENETESSVVVVIEPKEQG